MLRFFINLSSVWEMQCEAVFFFSYPHTETKLGGAWEWGYTLLLVQTWMHSRHWVFAFVVWWLQVQLLYEMLERKGLKQENNGVNNWERAWLHYWIKTVFGRKGLTYYYICMWNKKIILWQQRNLTYVVRQQHLVAMVICCHGNDQSSCSVQGSKVSGYHFIQT